MEHRSVWSDDQQDISRSSSRSFESTSNPRNHGGTYRPTNSFDTNFSAPLPKSRRTLRQSNSVVIGDRRAYPLPDPSQFELPDGSVQWDPNNDILYPMQTLMRSSERERATAQDTVVNSLPKQRLLEDLAQHTSIDMTDKQPTPSPSLSPPASKRFPKSSGDNSGEVKVTEFQQEQKNNIDAREKTKLQVPSMGTEVLKGDSTTQPSNSKAVVVVYDGEKKFSVAALDIAISGYATSEGDAIVVVAFVEHILSPMGMKMAADVQQFGGVNDAILSQTIAQKRAEIESKLRDTSRLQVCLLKKIELDVKVLLGSNGKALVLKEILACKATSVIFDRNALKHRKYYQEHLTCQVLRLRSDGRRVETISLVGQGLEKMVSFTSHCSDSSSDSSNSEPTSSPSLWSKMSLFGSRRSTGPLHHSNISHGCNVSSPRTSSNLGSPRPVQVDDATISAVLEKSFSFDSPKPNPAEIYAYEAAGLENYNPHLRSGGTHPKALAV